MSASLKIAIIAACPFPLARGTPVRILRMAEALAGRGHEVHVATYHLGTGVVSPRVNLHRIRELAWYQKLSPGPTYRKLAFVDPILTRLVRGLLQQHRFDVIHGHHYEGLLVGAAARVGTGVPLVYDAHTLLMSELPFYSLGLPYGIKRGLGRWMDGWMPRLADHTVCVTDTIRNKLVADAGYTPSRVSVITNGVEYEHFDPDVHPTAAVAAGGSFIFTGNLAEYQGIDLMLKAFAAALPRIPAARLRIASDSSFEPYEALARDLGIRQRIDVISSPAFSELPGLLAASDVAINPRVDCDGVPVKLLNYMASGRPVVSFVSSAPGVVHERTGWLVESGNVSALADGMVTLLQNPELAQSIGRAARQYVAENCRWQVVAERCETLYRNLIEARK